MKISVRTKAVTQHFLKNSFKKLSIKRKEKKEKSEKHKKYMFSKFLLRHVVVRVFVSSLVLGFVRAILSWCPLIWHIYIVYKILCVNISSIYIVITQVMNLLNGIWRHHLLSNEIGQKNCPLDNIHFKFSVICVRFMYKYST